MTGATRRLPVSAFGAEIWLVDLTVPPTAHECLSALERTRAERLVFEADRRRFRAAHCALRELLAPHLELDATDIEFGYGEHGKPFVAGFPGLRFNMSHSGERALIALSRELVTGAELGVDIEEQRGVTRIADLAAAQFTSTEQRELSACAPESSNQLFLSGWTRKEACLKAVGSGLSIAPSTFDCALAPIPARTRIATAAGIVFIDVESIDVEAGYLAAVAITRPDIVS